MRHELQSPKPQARTSPVYKPLCSQWLRDVGSTAPPHVAYFIRAGSCAGPALLLVDGRGAQRLVTANGTLEVFVHVDIANISRAGGQTRPVMKPQINGSRRVGGTPKVTWHWGPDVYFYLWEGVENREQRDCLPQMLATSF